jgi:hypothetical protein
LRDHLPAFPFGTDFTPVEQRLIPALQIMQTAASAPMSLASLGFSGFSAPRDKDALARMKLDTPRSISDRFYALLLNAALAKSKP